MQKTIRDYIPCKVKSKKILVQARVESHVVNKVKKIMKSEGLNWSKVINACLAHFADDRVK